MPADDPHVERWLQFAREDLDTALVYLADASVPPRQACYMAQQAAEKALKGCILACGGDYPRSHDLDFLRTLLRHDWRVHEDYPVLAELTEWLVEARYPGDWPDATERDARTAVELADGVLEVLLGDLGRYRSRHTSG